MNFFKCLNSHMNSRQEEEVKLLLLLLLILTFLTFQEEDSLTLCDLTLFLGKRKYSFGNHDEAPAAPPYFFGHSSSSGQSFPSKVSKQRPFG